MPTEFPRAAPIATDRLELEPLTVDHAVEMMPVLADASLYTFTGGTPPTLEELTRRYARQSLGRSPDGTQVWLNWVIRRRATRAAVGTVQATLDGGDVTVADVAWVIAAREQGRGFATEAATAMVGWLRRNGVDAVHANIHPDHRASERVARALCLVPTAVTHDGERRWRDGGEDGRASL